MTRTKNKKKKKTRKITGGVKKVNCSPTSENSYTCYILNHYTI